MRLPGIAIWALLVAVSSAEAQPTHRPPIALPNGTWTVQGREIPGTRCGHWLVRLTNINGNLSGVVSLARGSVPIEHLTMLPGGRFAGTTRAGIVGSTHARAYKITGWFSGETVHLTLENDICPARHGSAVRRQ